MSFPYISYNLITLTEPFRRSSPTSLSLSPSIPDLDRGFYRSPPVSIATDLGRPLAVRPRFRPSPLYPRPGQASRRPSPASTGAFVVCPRPRRAPRRPSRPHQACHCQPSEFAGPLVPQCWQACRCPSPASTGVFAVHRDTGQTSGGSTRP